MANKVYGSGDDESLLYAETRKDLEGGSPSLDAPVDKVYDENLYTSTQRQAGSDDTSLKPLANKVYDDEGVLYQDVNASQQDDETNMGDVVDKKYEENEITMNDIIQKTYDEAKTNLAKFDPCDSHSQCQTGCCLELIRYQSRK